VFATPGCESNVKEIYDKVKELKRQRGEEIVVLNQFEEPGNALWHYAVTGPAMEDVFNGLSGAEKRFSCLFLTQGSAGTLGAADYIREIHSHVTVCAGEALQCPTLLFNGFGGHRIEGIGDKHVPWIHNIRNMDMVAGIDDEAAIGLMRLFNAPAGKEFLVKEAGVEPELTDVLDLLGISSIANLIGAVKMARYFELDQNDVIFTVATDSMEMYGSRMKEEDQRNGELKPVDAARIFASHMLGVKTDFMIEMNYYDKKRMHNLKYFTWIEQQGKTVEELNAQWYDKGYWKKQYAKVDEWDEKIMEFNEKTGLLKKMGVV